MIEIIKEEVKMPDLDKRRFQKEYKNNNWFVRDTETNKFFYKGKFEDVCLACHNLNKKFYRNMAS